MSTAMNTDTQTESVEEFRARARAWLADNYPRATGPLLGFRRGQVQYVKKAIEDNWSAFPIKIVAENDSELIELVADGVGH